LSLSINNTDTSTSILSIREIVGIVVVFSFMLYLVFPKKDIDDILKQKGENANLSINYLESMLLYYPENIELKLMLLENYSRTNRVDKAFRLIRDIKNSTKDKKILAKAYQLEYELLKERYFDTNNSKLLRKIRAKLFQFYEFQKDNRDHLYFLGEAEQLDFPKLKYLSLKGLTKTDPDIINFQLRKELYNLALRLGYRDEALEHLVALISYKEADLDLKRSVLYSLIEKKDYNKALLLAQKLFLEAKNREEAKRYFELSLYILSLKRGSLEDIESLVEFYISNQGVDSDSIEYIINNLLKMGDIKGANIYARRFFKEYRGELNEKNIDLIIKTLLYNKDVKGAFDVALYANRRFNNPKWLDKAITFATWQGDVKRAIELNMLGFREYGLDRYKKYISKNSNRTHSPEFFIKRLKRGDFSQISYVSNYFEYKGDIKKGFEFFKNLYKKYKREDILKELIEFAYKSGNIEYGLREFNIYSKRYGFDRDLYRLSAKELLKLDRKKEVFSLLKEIEKREDNYDFELYKSIVDLALKFKEDRYLYNILWKLENRGKLDIGYYNTLIDLEKRLNGGERLEYIYKEGFKRSLDTSYAMSLLYLYMEKREFDKFKNFLSSLSNGQIARLKKSIDFNLLLADYYANVKRLDKSLEIYKSLIKKYRYNPRVYKAYIWFMLNNKDYKPLRRVLTFLNKNPKLRKRVGFPAVVLALQYQKSDLALKWMRPIIKRDKKIEYQIVYSDILQLQDRNAQAYQIRKRVFKRLDKMLKSSPELRRDKHLVSLYLRFVNLFVSPIEKKRAYFNRYRSIFTKKEFANILAGAYSYSKSPLIVEELRKNYNLDESWLELYLAMSKRDNELKRKALRDVDTLPFRDRTLASRDIGNRKEALSLAFKGVEDNSRDSNIYQIYKDLVEEEFPRGEFKTDYLKLSSKLLEIENRLSYRWHLYKNIDIETFLNQYRYILRDSNNLIDSKVGIAIRSRYKNLIWNFEVAKHFARDDFWSFILGLNYRYKSASVDLKIKRRAKTTQNNQLRMIGIQNSVDIGFSKKIGNRALVGLSVNSSEYQSQRGEDMGDYRSLRFYSSYNLRFTYPDIKFETYFLISRFKGVERDIDPINLAEIGSSIYIGALHKNRINREIKPFGIFNISYNNRGALGLSFSAGFSKELTREDIFNISLNYNKSIDIFGESYYGISVGYFF